MSIHEMCMYVNLDVDSIIACRPRMRSVLPDHVLLLHVPKTIQSNIQNIVHIAAHFYWIRERIIRA
jgi:hypothetical protein